MSIPKEQHTAFSDAIETGNIEAVRWLIQQHPQLVNHPDWRPPPLHCAVLWNQPKIAETLLDHGADIELRDPDRDATPIEYAVVYCKTDLISLLWSRDAETDWSARGGSTLLQLAQRAAGGAFEQYDDLPRPAEYEQVVQQLQRLGIA